MSALGLAFRAALALGVVTAAIVAPSSAAEPDLSRLMTTVSGGMVKNLQLGVGKSVIVDLPEEASEIYVGDPRIANAVVRTAKRIMSPPSRMDKPPSSPSAGMDERLRSSKSRSDATSVN